MVPRSAKVISPANTMASITAANVHARAGRLGGGTSTSKAAAIGRLGLVSSGFESGFDSLEIVPWGGGGGGGGFSAGLSAGGQGTPRGGPVRCPRGASGTCARACAPRGGGVPCGAADRVFG